MRKYTFFMKKILSIFLLAICSFAATAGDTDFSSGTRLSKGGNGTVRPHKPSNEFISCEYVDGVLFFDLPEYIVYIDVVILDQNNCVLSSGSVENTLPQYEVTLYSGVYRVECHCLDNGTFSGYLEIQ